MKKLFLAIAILASIASMATPEPVISKRVLKAFQETFATAKDVVWQDFNDYSQASFKLDEIQVRAQYSDDGTLLKTIRYYNGDHLLPLIKGKIKQQYPGREIYGVTEVATDEKMDFTISICDSTHWYVLTATADGDIKEINKYKRAEN